MNVQNDQVYRNIGASKELPQMSEDKQLVEKMNSFRDVMLSVLKHQRQVTKGLSTIMNRLEKLEERVSIVESSKYSEIKRRNWWSMRRQVDNLELNRNLLQPLLCSDEMWENFGDDG